MDTVVQELREVKEELAAVKQEIADVKLKIADFERELAREQLSDDDKAFLRGRLTSLVNKEAALANKEAALANKEAALANKEAALANKEVELLKKEVELLKEKNLTLQAQGSSARRASEQKSEEPEDLSDDFLSRKRRWVKLNEVLDGSKKSKQGTDGNDKSISYSSTSWELVRPIYDAESKNLYSR